MAALRSYIRHYRLFSTATKPLSTSAVKARFRSVHGPDKTLETYNNLSGADISSIASSFALRHTVERHKFDQQTKLGFQTESSTSHNYFTSSISSFSKTPGPELFKIGMLRPTLLTRCITTTGRPEESVSQDVSESVPDVAPRIKFKRLDKTARHIMQILDKEAVQDVKERREIAREIVDIKPGYIIQLKVEVPENKRRVSTLKGIVIARRNAGLNSTFRIRRLVAGVGVESVFPLYSPNIKELKILEKKKVRRAKLYYLRDKMNALKKQTSR